MIDVHIKADTFDELRTKLVEALSQLIPGVSIAPPSVGPVLAPEQTPRAVETKAKPAKVKMQPAELTVSAQVPAPETLPDPEPAPPPPPAEDPAPQFDATPAQLRELCRSMAVKISQQAGRTAPVIEVLQREAAVTKLDAVADDKLRAVHDALYAILPA